jgi:hypothetical protein
LILVHSLQANKKSLGRAAAHLGQRLAVTRELQVPGQGADVSTGFYSDLLVCVAGLQNGCTILIARH